MRTLPPHLGSCHATWQTRTHWPAPEKGFEVSAGADKGTRSTGRCQFDPPSAMHANSWPEFKDSHAEGASRHTGDSNASAVRHSAVRKSSARLHHLRELHRARTQPQRPRSAMRPTSFGGSRVRRGIWVGRSVRISCPLSAAIEVARPASMPGLRLGRVPASASRWGFRGANLTAASAAPPLRSGLFYLTRQ